MPDLEKAEIPVAMKKGYRELELLRLEHNRRGAKAVKDGTLAEFHTWQRNIHDVRSQAICEVIAPLKDAHVAAEAKRLGIAVKDVDIVAIKQPLKDSTLYDSEIEAVE